MKSDKALFELMGCPWAGLGMMITLAVALTEGCRWHRYIVGRRSSRREPASGRIERRATGVMGAPGAPPLETPRRPVKNGAQATGAVDPSSPSGRYAEAPAAARLPALARREFPKSRPPAGPMLILRYSSLFPKYAALGSPRPARSTRQSLRVVSFSSRSAAGRCGRGRSEPQASEAGGGSLRSHIAP